ncbi:Rieske 2Fe-2S domain-containing protein [Desulfocapsa sp. AH-315-G09]|nr:Rieske 2Fe-2S domain-containing protein [Desulfocapsa sp.]MBN4065688.1 Rieske 2Fe-2S domain-containing protein [Desulfocapsa sp. AH-315-G09]
MIIDKKDRSPVLPGRRSFLSKIWIGLGIVALAECIIGGISFFASSRKNDGKDTEAVIIEAGDINTFLPGTVTLIHAGNCYLSRLDDGGLLAISRKCTHLACAVPWVAERNQFECPCHASIFDKTGDVIKSPAPRALNLYPISIENDMVKIDISRPTKRASFASDQLVYPEETA